MIRQKPRFSSPSRFSSGTKTSENASSPVSEARQPSFSSFFEVSNPSISRSRIRNEMPWWPPSSVVLTAVTTKSARTPFVMNVFEPFTT